MAVLRNPESEETKEMARWEMFPSEWTIGGLRPGNPYRKGNEYGKPGAEYPKMLYRAQQIPPGLPGAGKWATSVQTPPYFGFRDEKEWDRACQMAERFGQGSQTIVHGAEEHERAKNDGWCDTPTLAEAAANKFNTAISDAAANRAWNDRNMSPEAKAEVARVESEHFGHLPEIPRTPVKKHVKRGGRRAKAPKQAETVPA